MEMTQEQILTDKVRSLLAGIFRISFDEVPPDMAFGDIPQWDSFGHMEVMINLEEQYGVEITTETISELVNIPMICAYLEKKGS